MEGACSPESYVGLGRRWRRRRPARGFRLCPRNKFSVRRLRAQLLTFLGLVGRYVRQLLLAGRLKRSPSSSSAGGGGGCSRSSSRRVLVVVGKHHDGGWRQTTRCRPVAPSFMRSNSFYAQAIADCLEFIKRNSVPVEDYASASGRRSSVDLTTI
ncbi:hypothetical protein E2562_031673 [Oryza meyeriana var. granulata]|uniref:Uncharacterized protein n=1 Tax=Oryza meyeriana var. granulata TaxID=110450 RepID=A0A6G1E793_9ORYZ|nr:hypothetical protein E2562_031673 [Oryza meyeriana var. granulata]